MNSMLSHRDLFVAIVAPVLYDQESPYQKMMGHLSDINNNYIARLKPISNRFEYSIPAELKHHVLADFLSYWRKISEEIPPTAHKILFSVDQFVSSCPDRSEAIVELKKAMSSVRTSVHNQICYIPVPKYSRHDLAKLRHKAERVPLAENVAATNTQDVERYFAALLDHTIWVCRLMARRRTGQFLIEMVDNLACRFNIGSVVEPVFGNTHQRLSSNELPEELIPLAELMAENVHEAWIKTRMEQGWTYGKKRDDINKKHPCLVPYEQLPEEERTCDRNTSIETLRFILDHGFRIVKEP